MQIFAAKCNIGRDFEPMKVAETLVKSFEVFADGEKIFSTNENHLALVKIRIGRNVKELKIVFKETHGCRTAHVFSCDIS
ncbi:MAG: hypothetical protein IJV00_05430 [Clostridia bacterium]|nr:hypothetical protein [Clostridia bacterium]